MKNKITILLILFAIISCKQVNKEKPNLQVKIIPKEVLDIHTNCFTNENVKKIRKHFELLEKTMKLGKKYDFSKSPISYTKKEKEWLKKILNKSICKGELNNFSGSCPKNIIYTIDCSEVLIIDDEEHFSEQDFWNVLSKKDDKIFVSDSGGSG